MPEASMEGTGTVARSSGLDWAASLFGFKRCCVGTQPRGADEQGLETSWKLESDEKLSSAAAKAADATVDMPADKATPAQGQMPPPLKDVALPLAGAEAVAKESELSISTAASECAVADALKDKTDATAPQGKGKAKAKSTSAAAKKLPKPREGEAPVPSKRTTAEEAEIARQVAELKKGGKADKKVKEEREKKPKKKKKEDEPFSILERVQEEKRKQELKAKEMSKLVDEMFAGKYDDEHKKKKGQPAGNMLVRMPTPYERKNMKLMIMERYRAEYNKLKKQSQFGVQWMNAKTAQPCSETTQQYTEKEVQGLTIQGGHQHMPRPQNVKLPKDFRKPVGEIPLKKLKEHDENSNRLLVAVYGDIFDVSDRPDKYGPDGPYSWMTGHDLTWGFVSGRDVPETRDFFYDLWKITPEDFREKKLNGICAWLAWYEYEYGGVMGKLTEYSKEVGLKGPPMEEAAEDCSIM